MGKGVAFGGDKNVLKCIVLMVSQFCEYTKSQLIVHLKLMNYVVCALYPNKVVIFKKKEAGCGTGTSRNHHVLNRNDSVPPACDRAPRENEALLAAHLL